MPFYSQCSQDQNLERYVFKGFQNGVFVDVGAHDGVSLNNTLFFEETHNWSGINIEPIQSVYAKLVVARPRSINLHCAVCNQDGTAEFIQNTGATEMLSGLVDHYDPRHIRRVQGENNQNGGKTELITVETKRLETILDQHNIQHIHYLSIDVRRRNGRYPIHQFRQSIHRRYRIREQLSGCQCSDCGIPTEQRICHVP